MPTYDFRCPAGHDFERRFSRISDSPSEVECPSCGAVATRQISGGAGLLFKGTGFYITDYGKDGKKDQKGAGKPDAGKEKGDAAAKSESGGKTEGGAKSEGSAKSEGGAKSDAKPASAPTKPAPPSKPAGGE